jgi:hypothetical protein
MHIALLTLPGNFHAQKWARMLQAAGAQVSIYSFEATTLPEVRCVQVPAPGRWRGRYHMGSYLWGGPALRRMLQQDRVDVVHALHLTPFGVWGLRSGLQPLIAGALGADVLEYSPHAPAVAYGDTRPGWGPVRRLKRRFYGRLVRQVVAGAALVTADNQVLQQALTQHLGAVPQKVRLLPWGVAPEVLQLQLQDLPALQASLGLPSDKRLVLAPRGLTAFYQAEVVAQAFQQLLAAGGLPGHVLVQMTAGYAADARILAQCRALAAAYPGQYVLVENQLTAAQMGLVWHLTDVAISAPLYDGYAATVAEARATDSLLLVNDIAAYRELLQPNVHARYVHPFTADSLAAAVADTLAHLPDWQARLLPPNRVWAATHARGEMAARHFLTWCAELLTPQV